jgi:hypothetical protein
MWTLHVSVIQIKMSEQTISAWSDDQLCKIDPCVGRQNLILLIRFVVSRHFMLRDIFQFSTLLSCNVIVFNNDKIKWLHKHNRGICPNNNVEQEGNEVIRKRNVI